MDMYLDLIGWIALKFIIIGAGVVVTALSAFVAVMIISLFFWIINLFIKSPVIARLYSENSPNLIISVLCLAFFSPLGYIASQNVAKNFTPKVERKIVYDPPKIERFILAEFNPPKHVYVTLKHSNTGQLYEGQYVSKHCNNRPEIGAEYNIVSRPYYYEDDPTRKFINFQNLYEVFCK